ncbi:IclR family transcriptional regulator C-terminal domain-containing protein [Streptomyces antimycoticus]|uniref:IclR family transcriptional regulator domain-containing protein n=1 Tax=Streptomyces antimycoticus TaxID=68175 RepID=UPI003423EA21
MGVQAMAHTLNPATAYPILDQLGAEARALAVLSVLSPSGGPGRQIVVHAGHYSLGSLGLSTDDLLPVTTSLRVGPSGRVMLAHLPSPLCEFVLTQPIPAGAGPGVLRHPAVVLRDLETVRMQGFAVGREEITGWDSIAAPVLWADVLVGAVSVLMPAVLMRALPDSKPLVSATIAAAARLSELASAADGPEFSLTG